MGTAKAKKGEIDWPIAMIQREEHDGTRCYYIEKEMVRIKGENSEKSVPREDFGNCGRFDFAGCQVHLRRMKSLLRMEWKSFWMKSQFSIWKRRRKIVPDFYIAFWHPEAPLSGFSVRSRLGAMNPLLDGGRAANLKLEQSGVKFATPTVNKINALPETPNEVAERMLLIERLGGVLKYSDVADRVFRSNLLMIDLHFPRVLTEMVRIMHLDDITRISELTEVIKQMNPLKIKDELVNKHGFYEFKVKQFLMALALGMRPAKIYTGQDSAVEGILLMDGSGEVLCYHKSEKPVMEDFLFLNTRLEKGSLVRTNTAFWKEWRTVRITSN